MLQDFTARLSMNNHACMTFTQTKHTMAVATQRMPDFWTVLRSFVKGWETDGVIAGCQELVSATCHVMVGTHRVHI